jgi:pyruvate dehydrogenase E2 component (dihydrolipoamide acetyltransferase)
VPVVRDDGRIEPATVMRLCATFDHRILDGAHAAKMASVLKGVFADPWKHFGGVERAAVSGQPSAVSSAG